MKVLIVSHTVISRTGNMGKTILSYFNGFHVDEMAQFYIHSEIPTDDTICRNYYRFTDQDALKSIFSRKYRGKNFVDCDIQTDRETTRTDAGTVASIYQLGTKRSGAIYIARNLIWALSGWKNDNFKKWVLDFAPDVVFFMSGDYGFMYDIARYAADLVNKPLVICCVDDYYIHNRNEHSVIGRIAYRYFMKKVKCAMERTSCLFSICDKMSREYAALFDRPCHTLHTAAVEEKLQFGENAAQISYIGNLGLGRHQQIITIGRALKALGRENEPLMLDVYSAEQDEKILAALTEENGIRFHGRISADEVKNVMSSSIAVIHTESFDRRNQDIVRYSVSTKIAESLMYGPCLLAYGPTGIASIDYLKDNKAAYVITSVEGLQAGLNEVIGNAHLRAEIVANARRLAHKNHTGDRNSGMLREKFEEICTEGKRA